MTLSPSAPINSSFCEGSITTKAFSAITIKALREDAREIEGIASTPALDRVKDIVEPLGLTFAADAPLLLNHDHSQPVGTVQFGTPSANSLPFKATIAKVDEPGIVKDRTDEAWHSVKSGLIKGVSIGFQPQEYEPSGVGKGIRYTKASVHELSLVAIPANPDAVITAFKSLSMSDPATSAEGTTQGEPAGEPPATPVVKTPRSVAIDLSFRSFQ
ncbi:HK97 family phage prohead protease [Burkholderia ubonensis]|uniref:HK97 family phage prohead protease n=1 Tax=Burkholderia ubonensis TaxID=101571 RepID=UPI001E5AB133|nr:HK97 family phage prohead protease [Burkholderia ubonensis]